MFSIIIPLYNKGSYIQTTIESVLKQTLSDFEIIVVNDGSTDDSLERVKFVHDERVKVFSKENGGVSSARNYGIDKAKYDLIAFLDADDVWEPDYLMEMSLLINKYPQCGMYSANYEVIYKNKSEIEIDDIGEGVVEDYFKVCLNKIISWTSATIVRKEVFQNVGGFPVGMVAGQDTFMWAKIADKYRLAFTPKVLAKYNYIHSGIRLRTDKLDTCKETWFDLYKEGDFYRNEYLARKGLTVAKRYALGLYKKESRNLFNKFKYTKLYKKEFYTVKTLVSCPSWLINLYKRTFKFYMDFKIRYSNA
ncbi:glycosyltransferase family 2 protein [Mucilaginibacter litoreus]|uniref:Glycosyltransferase family 2 protein n=1 Tax=Mucilaginibacter litoreus TaxID=1048221 RepID=A0ABW3AVQ0_9SPHI